MKDIQEIVVIYDTSNQGKTSTLRELVNLLANSMPNTNGDIRAIIQDYHVKGQKKKVNIYIATCGDTTDVIEDNIRFFRSKMPDSKQYPCYLYKKGKWDLIQSRNQISDIKANICFSACRTDGNGVDAMQYFIHRNLAYTFASVWIRLRILRQKLNVHKTKRKTPDWTKLASELKNMIDCKFARRIK